MKKKPLVSVCMPLYNAEPYLSEAIEGILRQTYKNLELVICDNCSTDGSFELAAAYARKNKRIRLFRNRENIGYAGNLHKVASLAKGSFMMVHCADDTAEPLALERFMEVASRSDVDPSRTILMSDAYITDGKGRRTHVAILSSTGFENADVPLAEYVATHELRRFKGGEMLTHALARVRMVGWLGAIMYSRQLYDALEGVYNGRLMNPDKHYTYKLLSQNPEVIWIQEPLFSWRIHESNQTAQQRSQGAIKEALDDYIYTFEYSEKFLRQYGIRREDMAAAFIERECLRQSLTEIKDGNALLAFRHLCFSLATYPRLALQNPKFYVGLVGCLTGPIGRAFARLGYRAGIWRTRV